jgi:uncharacterized membrane protein YeiB
VKPDRITPLDQFRGFAILMMALANYMGGVAILIGGISVVAYFLDRKNIVVSL